MISAEKDQSADANHENRDPLKTRRTRKSYAACKRNCVVCRTG
jgi:hypothetical protein